MSDTTEQTIRSPMETCDTDWPDTPANSAREHLSIVIYGHVESGKSNTTERHLFELGGVPEREPGESTQETIRLEKSSFAFAFYMDKQTEDKKLGVVIACSTKDFFIEKWNSITINAPGYKDFIGTITGAPQDDATFIMVPAGENTQYRGCQRIQQCRKNQEQTRQHLRLIIFLE